MTLLRSGRKLFISLVQLAALHRGVVLGKAQHRDFGLISLFPSDHVLTMSFNSLLYYEIRIARRRGWEEVHATIHIA